MSLAKASDDGALGSGEMDGADPEGQGSLEVVEDVVRTGLDPGSPREPHTVAA